MNIEHFVARRIALTKDTSFTRMIIKIAIAAIAISLSIMILTTAIINGFKKEITDKIFGFWGHMHITDTNINRNFELKPIDTREAAFDDIKKISQIEYESPLKILGIEIPNKTKMALTNGGVKGMHPFAILPGLLNTKEDFHGVLLKGIDSSYDWQRISKYIIQGEKIKYNDSISSDVLVSRTIAEKLKIKVGNKVIMAFIRDRSQIKRRFTVTGIYNTGLDEYDRRFCIVDLKMVQSIVGWLPYQAQGMEVIFDNVNDVDVLSDYVYYEKMPQNLYGESIRQKFPSIFEWLNLQDINEQIILILMVIVAIINMITVLLILILERSRMIGILKSLGMANWQVRKIFLYNAGYIILYGLIWGNFLGLGLAWFQQSTGIIKLDEANYYLNTAPISINFSTIALLNIGVLVFTLLFLIIPTSLVSRITPIKVLRFE
jgi:lipoprotein-releasing system permease protein